MAPAGKSDPVNDAEAFLRALKYLRDLNDADKANEAISSYENFKEWWKAATRTQVQKEETGKKWLKLLNDEDWRNALELIAKTVTRHKAWTISLAN